MKATHFTFLIIICLGLFPYTGISTTVKDFSGGAFTIKPRDGFIFFKMSQLIFLKGLYFIDIGMDNLNTGGDLLSAFGDFNGDKLFL